MRYIIPILLILFSFSFAHAEPYWVLIRTWNKTEITIGSTSKKGDVVDIIPVKKHPYIGEKDTFVKEWLILKVDLSTDEYLTLKAQLRQVWFDNGDVIAYRRYKINLDAFKVEVGISKELGEVSVNKNIFTNHILKKTDQELHSYLKNHKQYVWNKRIRRFSDFFLAPEKAWAATENDIDPGGTGDYPSLLLWEEARDASGGDETAFCFSSDGTHDTDATVVSGMSGTVLIEGTDFPSNGQWDANEYVFEATNSIYALHVRDDNFTTRKIQIYVTASSSEARGFTFDSNVGAASHTVDKCHIKGNASGGNDCIGAQVADANSTATIQNSIIEDFEPTDSGCVGLKISVGVLIAYNNTITKCYYGARDVGGTSTIKNCALFNNTDDIRDFDTVSYNATDEGAGEDDAANGVDISGTWDSTCFTDANGLGPDWSVQDTDSPLYHKGTNVGLSTDIVNTAWNDPPSIGAYEYSAGAPAAKKIFDPRRRGQIIF